MGSQGGTTDGDYFIADTDTSHGSSGAPALDVHDLAVTGVFVRGGLDAVASDAGCLRAVREPDGHTAVEQFTHIQRAVERLCAADPTASSLCRSDCGDPCAALPPPRPDAGCAVAGPASGPLDGVVPLLLLLAAWLGADVPHGGRHRARAGRRPRWR
ncbi:MAG TPA: hypothetical protein VFH68_10345 [Polyangia bacterium]|nr:hypothetical protein [Polyangia bacterium]